MSVHGRMKYMKYMWTGGNSFQVEISRRNSWVNDFFSSSLFRWYYCDYIIYLSLYIYKTFFSEAQQRQYLNKNLNKFKKKYFDECIEWKAVEHLS